MLGNALYWESSSSQTMASVPTVIIIIHRAHAAYLIWGHGDDSGKGEDERVNVPVDHNGKHLSSVQHNAQCGP